MNDSNKAAGWNFVRVVEILPIVNADMFTFLLYISVVELYNYPLLSLAPFGRYVIC